MGKVKTAKGLAEDAGAGDILDMLGDVKVEDKKKESSTPRLVTKDTAVVAALVKFEAARKRAQEAKQEQEAAAKVIDPAARSAHQDKSRLDHATHKSVHIYDEGTMNGVTYTLGRFSPGDEAKGKKVGVAREALKAIFGDKFDEYFKVAVELSIKEEESTSENIKLIREKLGEELFRKLFVADPCIRVLTNSMEDKQQKLMRDFVLDDGVQQKCAAAAMKKLLKRGYDALK